MYLTQMPLNPQRRATRELVLSPQRMHAAVLAGFLPGAPERGECCGAWIPTQGMS